MTTMVFDVTPCCWSLCFNWCLCACVPGRHAPGCSPVCRSFCRRLSCPLLVSTTLY